MSSFGTDESSYNTPTLNLSSASETSTSDTSSTTSDSSSDDVDMNYDSEIEDIIEDIYFHEEQFLDSEKVNDHYYIGINKISNDKTDILYANSVTTASFFRYDIPHIAYYLQEYSIFRCNSNIDNETTYIRRPYIYCSIEDILVAYNPTSLEKYILAKKTGY